MSISGALTVQEVRAVLESLRDEMRPLIRNKAELWKGVVVEVIGSSVRVSRGDEPTTSGSLLRQPYPVVGSIPSVGAEVWAASWLGGGIVITGGTSGAVGVTSIEGQSGTVDIAGTGGIAVSGTGGTVTIDGSGVSGGGGGLTNPVSHIDYTEQASSMAAPAADTLRMYGLALTGDFTVPEMLTQDGKKWRPHRDKWQNAYNNTGSTIPAGTVVRNSGTTANGFEIVPARADALSTMPGWAVTMDSIATGARGWVMLSGLTHAVVNTSGMTIGDTVYVSPTTAGGITTTRPSTTGQYVQPLGIVTTVGTSGIVFLAGNMHYEIVGSGGGGGVSSVESLTGAVDVQGTGGIAINTTGGTLNIDGSGVSGGGGSATPFRNRVVQASDSSSSTGALVNAGALSFQAAANTTYGFWAVLSVDVDATTSGVGFAVNGPGTPSILSFFATYTSSTTGTTSFNQNTYDTSTFSSGSAYTTGNTCVVRGTIRTNTAGTVNLRFRSESSGLSATIKAGSTLDWWEAADVGTASSRTVPAPFAFADPLVAVESWPWPITKTYTVRRARVKCMTAPATTNTIFAIKKNGTSLGTVTVNAGATTGVSSDLATGVVDGDYLNVECTQVHASTMGTKYTVVVELEAAG